MKKFSIIVGILALVSLSACRKSRTCECFRHVDGEEQPKIDNTFAIENQTKQTAINICNESDTTEVAVDGTHYTTNCELK